MLFVILPSAVMHGLITRPFAALSPLPCSVIYRHKLSSSQQPIPFGRAILPMIHFLIIKSCAWQTIKKEQRWKWADTHDEDHPLHVCRRMNTTSRLEEGLQWEGNDNLATVASTVCHRNKGGACHRGEHRFMELGCDRGGAVHKG